MSGTKGKSDMRTTIKTLDKIEAQIDECIAQLEEAKRELRSKLFARPVQRMEFVGYALDDAKTSLERAYREVSDRTV